MKYFALVVGAGFTGATIAERIATQMNKTVLLVDSRDHVGGNAADNLDRSTSNYVPKFGPHYFHTNSDRVWQYISQFSEFTPYAHHVQALVHSHETGRLVAVPLPINFKSIRTIFGNMYGDMIREALLNIEPDARRLYNQNGYYNIPINDVINKFNDETIIEPAKYLFNEVYEPYSRIMWGPDVSIDDWKPMTNRIPIRLGDFNQLFFDKYQGQPSYGYSSLIGRMVKQDNIAIELGVDGKDVLHSVDFEHLIWTGPIDYFYQYSLGKLPYRSMNFDVFESWDISYQDAATMNYPNTRGRILRSTDVNFGQKTQRRPSNHDRTNIIEESPRDPDYNNSNDLLYPIPIKRNIDKYMEYKEMNDYREETGASRYTVDFAGRQGSYQYMEMGQAIGAALMHFDRFALKYS